MMMIMMISVRVIFRVWLVLRTCICAI